MRGGGEKFSVQPFSKGCDLKSNAKRCTREISERGARAAGDSPGSGRGGTREIPRRPALRLPFPPACAKGRRTLSQAGQAGLRKSSWHRRCHQGVSPAGSVGAERCPPGTSAPRRGFPLRKGPPGPFSNPFLRLPKATKAARHCLALCKPFEKGLSENFTCLHLT